MYLLFIKTTTAFIQFQFTMYLLIQDPQMQRKTTQYKHSHNVINI